MLGSVRIVIGFVFLTWRYRSNWILLERSCRACVVFEDRLYVLGGQEGDFMAKPGSPIFKCSRRNEVIEL